MNKIILFTLTIILFLTGCDPFQKEAMDFYQSTNSTTLASEHVQSISIHSTESEIINEFGKPEKTEKTSNPTATYLIYEGLEFGLKENKVFRYHFQNNEKTAKGITIGDQKEKVISEYGPDYYERVEGGNDTLGYFEKENKLHIEFGFQEDKLVTVIVEEM